MTTPVQITPKPDSVYFTKEQRESARRDGYLGVCRIMDSRQVVTVAESTNSLFEQCAKSRVAGVRNSLLQHDVIRAVALEETLPAMASELLAAPARPVRVLLFDKTAGTNWAVPWHQDLNIAVRGATKAEGFGPWTTKEGVPHVIPPVAILRQMITARFHLDDCGEESGPLRVAPGSHVDGVCPLRDLDTSIFEGTAVDCIARAGEVLWMSPLVFHSSRRATSPRRRRIIHIEYAAAELPAGLDWYFT